MKSLAKDLILNISLEQSDPECVLLSLTIPSHGTLLHRCEVGTGTTNRAYHRIEAIVIGMRQLVDKAVKENLISVSLGVSRISSTDLQASDKSTMSSTEWGF